MTITLGDIQIRFLIDAGGPLSMFEVHLSGGARVPLPHSHDAFEETVYGLHGSTTWTVDGEPRALGQGEAILIPRGVVHGFDSDGPAAFLAVATPGTFGSGYFEDLREVLAGGGPPDPAAIGAVMRRHGLTPAR